MELQKQVTTGIMDETMLIVFEQIVGLMEEVKDQYGRIYDSVETLISRKRLSTALASPPDVYRELLPIAALLKQDGLELLMEESQEVYEMDASYILFDNMTLAIYVHLPVGCIYGWGSLCDCIIFSLPHLDLIIEQISL